MMRASPLLVVMLMSASLLVCRAPTAMSACNPSDLLPCLAAFTGNGNPSAACCSRLRQQAPCYCQYVNNPSLKGYINSPNGRKIAAACGVSIPNC